MTEYLVWFEDIALGQRREIRTAQGKEAATEQRRRRGFQKKVAFPMRAVDAAYKASARQVEVGALRAWYLPSSCSGVKNRITN